MLFFSNKKPTPPLSLETIYHDISRGAALIDVRTAGEYGKGHAAGAQNISLQDIKNGTVRNGTVGALRKDQKIYVYCRSGSRSALAQQLLEKAGFLSVVDIGSLYHWQKMGGEIV